jgi:hypothetical protein
MSHLYLSNAFFNVAITYTPKILSFQQAASVIENQNKITRMKTNQTINHDGTVKSTIQMTLVNMIQRINNNMS